MAHWKHRLQKAMPEMFAARRAKHEHDQEAFQAPLYQPIGPRKVELDWVKKTLDLLPEGKRTLIEPDQPHMSLARACDLGGGRGRVSTIDHQESVQRISI